MLVIFDCDGVLVDSEVLAARVFSTELKKNKIDFSPEECLAQFRGRTLSACYQFIYEKFGRELPDNFDAQLAASTENAFNESLKPVAGVKAILDILAQNNIPICVASNGSHTKIKHSLSKTGLLDYFHKARFSAYDVEVGKPNPALFLHAAKMMRHPINDCRVIEDSDSGIRAALAAGMQTFAYRSDYSERMSHSVGGMCKEDLSRLTHFDDMLKLAGLLGVEL